MEYDFEWDPRKAQSNLAKHGVSFRQGAAVFKDPNMMTIFDEAHSLDEERWITLGLVGIGQYLLVVHTFTEIDAKTAVIRIISARKAKRFEVQQYEGDR
jgi:uncharacterized protein